MYLLGSVFLWKIEGKSCIINNSIVGVAKGDSDENNYYYSAYTVSSSYKWYGRVLDRLLKMSVNIWVYPLF